MSERVDQVRRAIENVIAGKGLELVADYYDEDGPFAGRLFDGLANNNPLEFTAEDLVAASLLDVRFDPRAVRALLVESSRINDLLYRLGSDRPLWEVEDLAAANSLWAELRRVPIGPTRTSKLLARKRPGMLPILDSVISRHLCLDGAEDRWVLLRESLADENLREAIDAMAPREVQVPSTLRLLDVATWMRYSESTNARRVRKKHGLPVAARPED